MSCYFIVFRYTLYMPMSPYNNHSGEERRAGAEHSETHPILDPWIRHLLRIVPELGPRCLPLAEMLDDDLGCFMVFSELADLAAERLALPEHSGDTTEEGLLSRIATALEISATTGTGAQVVDGVIHGFLDALAEVDLESMRQWLGPETLRLAELLVSE